ncbi:MAG: hypothetical protein H6696_10830 [Deferribacteres bacterium]|nr:hypothetical protein [candidate division KSB1 bacterium]MCB9502425.1 hypothetical protein [Deferribacteres bacterium]
MKYRFLFVILSLCAMIFLPGQAKATEQTAGLDIGFYDGTGWHAHWKIAKFAQGFPAAVRFGIGRSTMDPGNAAAARRIFINNVTNGVPQEKGSMWNFRLDVILPVVVKSLIHSRLFVGPRLVKFKGNFKYVGGNEDFDVISTHWGFGVGLESSYKINRKFSMRLSTGIDYFKGATLEGHDTSYSPDGTIVNQREDYNYNDANKAINQPTFELRLMAGVLYKL